MFPGTEDLQMTVVVPTEVASSAAISLVVIPPVPTLEPVELTSTFREEISSTMRMGFAVGSDLGLAV